MRQSDRRLILSGVDREVCQRLLLSGYDLFVTQEVEEFLPFEKFHADMQCLIADDTAFVLPQCRALADLLSKDYTVNVSSSKICSKYPYNIALNVLLLDGYIIGRLDFADEQILEFARLRNLNMINVRQGYTRCSCAVVNGNSVITEDESIFRALKETDVDVLKIQKGYIRLDGADYGFIGGASGLIENDVLFFTGDITVHPDYNDILSFCEERKVSIACIKGKPLEDIGGIIKY